MPGQISPGSATRSRRIKKLSLLVGGGGEDVALISAEELASLAETAHLLRSPKNAERLLRALDRARARTERPQGIDEFREEVGLGKKA